LAKLHKICNITVLTQFENIKLPKIMATLIVCLSDLI